MNQVVITMDEEGNPIGLEEMSVFGKGSRELCLYNALRVQGFCGSRVVRDVPGLTPVEINRSILKASKGG